MAGQTFQEMPESVMRVRLARRHALLAQLHGRCRRIENELVRVLLRYGYKRPADAPEVVERVDELNATRQAIKDEIAALKGGK
jgi:hypothetical protein